MELRFSVQTKIQKPVSEAFDAVYNPAKLSAYFTSGGSDGPLDEGATVIWTFSDHEGQSLPVPVTVRKVERNRLIKLTWEASDGGFDLETGQMPAPSGYDTTVEMTFESLGANETLVKITEGSWRATEGGLAGSYGNCQGWTHMSMCLKAWLEHGINLRKGSV